MNTAEYYNNEDMDSVFELIADMQRIKECIYKNYSPTKCGWTSERSEGNFNDCFNDGYEYGTSWAAYSISQILDMDLPEPELPDDF